MVTKQKTVQSLGLRLVPIHQVYWIYDRNPRKDPIDFAKDRNIETIARSFLSVGWKVSIGGAAGEVSTVADRKLAMDLRKEKWESLKAAAKGAGANAEPLYALQAFEDLYCTEPGTAKAALIPLGEDAVEGITCYRRSVAAWRAAYLVRANSVRKMGDKSTYESDEGVPETFPENFMVPIDVYPRMNAAERLIIQLGENNKKTDGAVKLTMKDNFIAGGILFASGDRQKAYRDSFKDGTGQKIYGIYLVDSMFPEVHLKKRVLMAWGLNEDLTPFEGQIHNLADGKWSYTDRKCAVPYEKLDKQDLGLFARGKGLEKPKRLPADKFGVEEYIKLRLSDPAKKVDAMNGDAMITVKNECPINQVKLALETAINNNVTALNAFVNLPGVRESHLALWLLCKHGHGTEAAKVLDNLFSKYEDAINEIEAAEREAAIKAEQQAKVAAESVSTASGEEHTPDEFFNEDSEVSEGVEHAVAGGNGKEPAAAKKGGRGKKGK